MRHLPRHYPFVSFKPLTFLKTSHIIDIVQQNSVYGVFPFFTPQKMKESLTKQGIVAQYIFDRPVATVIPKVLNTFTGIKYVFGDPARFKTVYDMKGLGGGYGFILTFDEPVKSVIYSSR